MWFLINNDNCHDGVSGVLGHDSFSVADLIINDNLDAKIIDMDNWKDIRMWVAIFPINNGPYKKNDCDPNS